MLFAGERCDGKRWHNVVPLRDDVRAIAAAESALARERWGLVSERAIAVVPPVCGIAFVVYVATTSISGAAVVGLGAMLVALMMALPGRGPLATDRLERLRRRGSGVDREAKGPPLTGAAEGAPTLTAPIGATPCLAFSLEYRAAFGVPPQESHTVRLVDEVTGGFDLRLDDGRLIRVPPGRVYLKTSRGGPDLRGSVAPRSPGDRHLGAMVPAAAGQANSLALDAVDETVLRAGDRVCFWGPLRRLADERTSPRAPVAIAYAPIEVPILEIVRDGTTASAAEMLGTSP